MNKIVTFFGKEFNRHPALAVIKLKHAGTLKSELNSLVHQNCQGIKTELHTD